MLSKVASFRKREHKLEFLILTEVCRDEEANATKLLHFVLSPDICLLHFHKY